jgi:hypothetical protein
MQLRSFPWMRMQYQPSILVFSVIGGIMTLISGCQTDGASGAGQGPSPALGVARALGVATDAPEPAEFVRAARPAPAPDYIPVVASQPSRPISRRDPTTLKQLEEDLESQRSRSRGFAARPKPPSSYDGKIPPRPALRPAPMPSE